jgi:group I intron endonuclease
MIGIYKITSPSGKIYIGQSIKIESRFKQYKKLSCKEQTRLYNSFLKYDAKNHIFEVIEECTIDLLNERERYWQEYYNVIGLKGLNCILIKTDSKRKLLSQETKEKLSKSLKGKLSGKKNPMYGRVGELNYFYGKKHTDKTKQIISEKNSGVNHAFYGKKRNKSYIDKVSGINHFNYGKKSQKITDMNKLRVGLSNSRSQIILDIISGVYYYSLKEYCVLYGIDISTFRYGYKKNRYKNIIIT